MALAFVKEPQEITFADSPQFVNIQEGSGAALETLTAYLYIWTGLKSPRPAGSLRYTLNLKPVDRPDIGVGATVTTFEISKFLREYIEADTRPVTDSSEYNEANGVWFDIEAEAPAQTLISSSTKFAVLGWGRHEDGTNPGTTVADQNGKVFGTHSSALIYDDQSDYLIPVFVGQGSTNSEIQSVQGGDFLLDVDLGYTLGSLLSTRQIAYVRIGKTLYGSAWENDKFLDYIINDALSSSSTTYRAFMSCFKGEAKSIKYLSASGTVSQLPIRGKKDETLRISRTRYRNNLLDLNNNYDTESHTNLTFDVNGTKVFNVTTNWLFEDSNDMVEELLLSKYIWLEVGSDVIPVIITDVNKKLINRTWEKQVGYEFTLETSYNLINQVL